MFKLTPTGSGYAESVIHYFTGKQHDGESPLAGVTVDASGAVYGTAISGGPGSAGVVFKLTPQASGQYTESLLHSFAGAPDGAIPVAGVIADQSGALYGETLYGGTGCPSQGCGTVYELAPSGSGYTETVLYSFQGGSDGSGPTSGLLAGAHGALFGITQAGGSCSTSGGCGTVFEVTP